MKPEILAIFVPIVFLLGLFAVIALNIISKYKTKEIIANRVGSVDEWHRTEAQVIVAREEARAARRRGLGLRVCGLLVGIGFGVFVGCMLLVAGAVPADTGFAREAIATFMIVSLAMVCGGAGMIGAYFLARRLNGNSTAGTRAAD